MRHCYFRVWELSVWDLPPPPAEAVVVVANNSPVDRPRSAAPAAIARRIVCDFLDVNMKNPSFRPVSRKTFRQKRDHLTFHREPMQLDRRSHHVGHSRKMTCPKEDTTKSR